MKDKYFDESFSEKAIDVLYRGYNFLSTIRGINKNSLRKELESFEGSELDIMSLKFGREFADRMGVRLRKDCLWYHGKRAPIIMAYGDAYGYSHLLASLAQLLTDAKISEHNCIFPSSDGYASEVRNIAKIVKSSLKSYLA